LHEITHVKPTTKQTLQALYIKKTENGGKFIFCVARHYARTSKNSTPRSSSLYSKKMLASHILWSYSAIRVQICM